MRNLTFVCFAVSACLPRAALAVGSYTVQTLPDVFFHDVEAGDSPLKATPWAALGINATGDVSGSVSAFSAFPGTAAFLYSKGTMTIIGSTSRQTGAAYGINNQGQAAYTAGRYGGYNNSNAYLYSHGVVKGVGFGLLNLDRDEGAYGINNQGDVVGASGVQNANSQVSLHAFLYSGGATHDLGTLGGDSSAAFGINDSGQIVGESATNAGSTHAFLCQDGSMVDLGTFGGTTSTAHAINASGLVVGSATDSSGSERAFLYENGVLKNLGVLPGTSTSRALGINSKGQIVGTSGNKAFIYSDGQMYDLGELLGLATTTGLAANAINDLGLIAGSVNGRAAVFSPQGVPEPGTFAVLGLGIGALLYRRKRL